MPSLTPSSSFVTLQVAPKEPLHAEVADASSWPVEEVRRLKTDAPLQTCCAHTVPIVRVQTQGAHQAATKRCFVKTSDRSK